MRVFMGRDDSRIYLQVKCSDTKCNVTGKMLSGGWSGRKWLLSPHMTNSEIVTTAFKALLTAVEHELREKFTYKGQAIFDPHMDVDRLVALRMQEDALSHRKTVV
jgi:hypothetical protein